MWMSQPLKWNKSLKSGTKVQTSHDLVIGRSRTIKCDKAKLKHTYPPGLFTVKVSFKVQELRNWNSWILKSNEGLCLETNQVPSERLLEDPAVSISSILMFNLNWMTEDSCSLIQFGIWQWQLIVTICAQSCNTITLDLALRKGPGLIEM